MSTVPDPLRSAIRQRGFTLVELMIVLVMVAALLGIGVPLFETFILDQRMRATSSDLRVALSTARSEAVKRNRLVELQRYSEFLNAPLNLKPKFFPVNGDDAARLIIAVDQHDGADAAMKITGAILAAVWTQDRHIDDEKVLAQLLAEQGLSPARLEQSHSQAAHQRYEANTQAAIDAGVFGAPSYVIDGEIFWGQDRLDFVARKLGK